MPWRYRLRSPPHRCALVASVRRPPVVLGMATITIGALFVAVLLILFSVNPSVDRNEGEIKRAVMSQHAIICAQVQNTANAYRFRSLTPSGEVEPIRHFLTRMQAQAQTLRLARGSECRSAPNFPPVGLQVRRALHQINEILQHFEPKLRKPVDQTTAVHKHASFSPRFQKPPNAGVDESGVPAKLHDKLAPSTPLGPERGSRNVPRETQAPEQIPAPVEAPVTPAPEAAQEEGATRVEDKPRIELPTVPTPVVLNALDETTEGLP